MAVMLTKRVPVGAGKTFINPNIQSYLTYQYIEHLQTFAKHLQTFANPNIQSCSTPQYEVCHLGDDLLHTLSEISKNFAK